MSRVCRRPAEVWRKGEQSLGGVENATVVQVANAPYATLPENRSRPTTDEDCAGDQEGRRLRTVTAGSCCFPVPQQQQLGNKLGRSRHVGGAVRSEAGGSPSRTSCESSRQSQPPVVGSETE